MIWLMSLQKGFIFNLTNIYIYICVTHLRTCLQQQKMKTNARYTTEHRVRHVYKKININDVLFHLNATYLLDYM